MARETVEEKAPATAERIAKAMARGGLCSRREAEAWIVEGRVTVNGQVITSPALNVTPADNIRVDGKPLPERERTRLFLYHKPRGLVTTHADPQGRPTIFAGLPKHLPRLMSVGRLDMNTEGLLLLTNDGGLARVLELPSTGWTRRYRVRANGKIQQDKLDTLRRGISIDGVRYGPIEARLDREQGANVWITFAMREGKNREVKNVLGHLGLAVNRLIRVSFGPFQLGELPEGSVDEVKTRHLREQLGEKVVELAGLDFSAPIVEREVEKPSSGSADQRSGDRRRAPRARTDEEPGEARGRSRPMRKEIRFGGKPARDRTAPDRPTRDRTAQDRPERTRSEKGRPVKGRSEKGQPEKGRAEKERPGKGRYALKRQVRSRDAERMGEPERARRERRNRPPGRGKTSGQGKPSGHGKRG